LKYIYFSSAGGSAVRRHPFRPTDTWRVRVRRPTYNHQSMVLLGRHCRACASRPQMSSCLLGGVFGFASDITACAHFACRSRASHIPCVRAHFSSLARGKMPHCFLVESRVRPTRLLAVVVLGLQVLPMASRFGRLCWPRVLPLHFVVQQ
jgi:hypothetical protein